MNLSEDYFSKNYFSDEKFSDFFEESNYDSKVLYFRRVFRRHHVANDPVNWSDPSGLCPWCVAATVGAVVAGGIDIGVQLATNGGQIGAINWTSVGTSALVGAALSALGPTGGLLGRGGARAAQYGYGESAGLLNRGTTRFGWSYNGALDRTVLSLRNGASHFDLPWLGLVNPIASPIRDGVVSGIIGAGANRGMCE